MFFVGVFLSIYSHPLKKLELFEKKSYRALKIPKMARSKLLKIFLKIEFDFFPFSNLLQGRYLIIKKNSFYFTFLSQSVLKL